MKYKMECVKCGTKIEWNPADPEYTYKDFVSDLDNHSQNCKGTLAVKVE